MRNLIIGYGTVGSNLKEELHKIDFDICDKYKMIIPEDKQHHIAFVCVDTPLVDGMVDCTEVENAVNENDAQLYVIKSTVYVGYTEALTKKTGKRIVFSPEYYGGTQHCNNFYFNYTIIGGDREDTKEVQQLLQETYDARRQFFLTDSKTAEMVKFMENSWLATKVTFCCEFFNACEKAGVDYELVREMFVADPRVNPSHTFVYRAHPYYKSHCLDKDVPSIANQFDIQLLKQVIEVNNSNKGIA